MLDHADDILRRENIFRAGYFKCIGIAILEYNCFDDLTYDQYILVHKWLSAHSWCRLWIQDSHC